MRGPAVAGVLVMLAVVVSGMVLSLWGGIYLWGETVQGEVVGLRWNAGRKGNAPGERDSEPSCAPEVAYQVDGRSYRVQNGVGTSPCDWAVGQAATIAYRPSRPDDGYFLGFGHTLHLSLPLGGAVLLLALAVRAMQRGPKQVDPGVERPEHRIFEIAQAPHGEVIGIRGRIESTGSSIEGPMSGRSGVAFELEVRRPIFGEEGELVHRASRADTFILRDGGGAQAALPAGTAVDVALAPDRRGSTENKSSERLTRLLTEAGLPAIDARTTDNHYVWAEGVVGEGDEVVVYGLLRPERDAAIAYRVGGARLVIEAPPGGEVVIVSEKRRRGRTKRRSRQRPRAGSRS